MLLEIHRIKRPLPPADPDHWRLVQSILQTGLQEPVRVDHYFRLVEGERRLRAAMLLGWRYIEVEFV